MTPDEIIALKKRHDLSNHELGRAIGLSDNNASRVVQSWLNPKGERDRPSPTAVAALRYLDAALCALELLDGNSEDGVYRILVTSLPPDLQERC